jgi:aspartyl/asparaginyl beta-hydroxylase (cupin superfamily)
MNQSLEMNQMEDLPVELTTRTHRLAPPNGVADKLSRWAQDTLEAGVARASRHGDPLVYATSQFPWAQEVEANWRKVRGELDQVMTFRDQIPSFQEILKEVSPIQTDHNWKTFFLAGIGMDCEESTRRCPETTKVLAMIPGMTTAFFSILSPGKHIPAHRGAYNGVLRLHLALQVPEPREKVRIRIGRGIHHWEEGKCLIFDDTYNHEVWNDTGGYRVVLFVDFARPLKQPWDWMNKRLLNVGALAPFLREANGKQQQWQKKFYRK